MGSLLLQSCATIIATPYQTVRVIGAPTGSTAYINDKEVKTKPIAGTTDFKVRVRRKKNAEIKIKHDDSPLIFGIKTFEHNVSRA